MKDFKRFLERNADDKQVVSTIAAIVGPIFGTYNTLEDHIKISRKIASILCQFKNDEEDRTELNTIIKGMQNSAIRNSIVVDKNTFDYSAAMNSLLLLLETRGKQSLAKKGINSAYAYVTSFCVSLERKRQDHDLVAVSKESKPL